jgi:hypothetical protein
MATPPVGADIESICGKCGDVWHVVVAKVGDKVAKVLCKQCGAQHRHKPPERPGAETATAAKAPKVKKARATGASAKKKASSKAASANEPMVNFDPDKPVKPYKASELFAVGDRVSHPSFGTGVVELSPGPGKMQVFFPDGRRVLACAKAASTIGPVPTRKDDGGKPPQGL